MPRPVEDALGNRYGVVVITASEEGEDERWLIPYRTFTREAEARRWLEDPRFAPISGVSYEIVPVSLRTREIEGDDTEESAD